MISAPGVGSGLNLGGIIEQLMAIERQPLVKLGVEQVELKTQISAFGKLGSTLSSFEAAMSGLSDLEKFQTFTATSSDKEVLTASAASDAAQGTFNIQVNRIAENHRMAAATVFADTGTTHIGTAGDTMTITVGATSFVVDIGDKTLADIRDAINDASDNAGVTASTLHDDTGYHLTLSANDTGSSSALAVAYSGVDPFSFATLNSDRDANPGFTSADLDASLTVENTFTVTRSTNSITDVIEGVTLDLVAAGTTTLGVARDTATVTASIKKFISAFNDVQSVLVELGKGVLRTDSGALRSLDAQFRNELNTPAETGGVFSFLFEIGVSTKTDGTLTLDTSILNSALEADFEGVANLFADTTSGVATRMKTLAGDLLATGGLIDNRKESLDQQSRSIEGRKSQLEFRLRTREARLVAQFTALDQFVSQLQSTGNFLTAQLSQISRIGASSRNG